MNIRYRIKGGKKLNGAVKISGSKNAALPLLAGSILCEGITTFHNVPDLRDIHTMLAILDFLGAKTSFKKNTVTVDASKLESKTIPHELVSKLRGSIVVLGPLLARFGSVEMAYPGGCVLGKRPVGAHIRALTQLGAEDKSDDETLRLEGKLNAGEVILPEFSVTATENALLAAATLSETTTIRMAAMEPHVIDVCTFLENRGVDIEQDSAHTIRVCGGKKMPSAGHSVISDYLEAGAFAIAALVTKSDIAIKGATRADLIAFLDAISRANGRFEWGNNGDLNVLGSTSDLCGVKIQTNIFPGFPTDLQAPFGVMMTQAQGVSRIFEVLYEGRMAYLYELEKMGAQIEILNAHQALIIGPTRLCGRTVASNDIRAGVAMVLAALCSEGETVITDVHYIERGYERLPEKLRSLGAEILREEE